MVGNIKNERGAGDILGENLMPVIITEIEKVSDSKWQDSAHLDDCFLLIYTKKGNAVLNIEGIDISLSPNSVIIIKAGKNHKILEKADKCEFVYVFFHFKKIDEEKNIHASINSLISFMEDEAVGDYVHLKLGGKNDIINVINKLLKEKQKMQTWWDYVSYFLIGELFVILSRALKQDWEQSAKSRNLKLFELLNIAKEYIDTNYAKDLCLSHVAKYIYLSDSYFAHSFKEKFGISPKSYILKVRIEAAKELLETTSMKISDIAKTVGFSSQQRFNDIFRKYALQTPLKYRQAQKVVETEE